MRGIRSFVSWVLALCLFAALVIAVDAKLLSDPEKANVVFTLLAERTGQELFEPTGRYVVGVIEAFVALMLILPFTRRFGAIILLVVSGALLAAHASPLLGQEIPLEIGSAKTDGASAFYLTMAMTIGAGLLMFIHPRRRRRRTYN
ncbi:hypothetical protein [Hirschia litorea]|uniref:DoxX family protein n=1 Tax=Hirschia litorea TaxID=1199156 RepID=A0ABW2IIM6_9PROT